MRDFTEQVNIHFERQLDIRGYSYTVIFGSHINGGFIAIPGWGVACEASDDLYNVGYNTEKLTEAGLNNEVAETISRYIDDWLKENEGSKQDDELQNSYLTSEMCLPDSNKRSFINQLLVVDHNKLSSNYKKPEYQLFYATGGFGCNPDSLGTKIYGQFITELQSGEDEQLRRSDFLGIADIDLLPEWALKKWNDYNENVLAPVILPDNSRK